MSSPKEHALGIVVSEYLLLNHARLQARAAQRVHHAEPAHPWSPAHVDVDVDVEGVLRLPLGGVDLKLALGLFSSWFVWLDVCSGSGGAPSPREARRPSPYHNSSRGLHWSVCSPVVWLVCLFRIGGAPLRRRARPPRTITVRGFGCFACFASHVVAGGARRRRVPTRERPPTITVGQGRGGLQGASSELSGKVAAIRNACRRKAGGAHPLTRARTFWPGLNTFSSLSTRSSEASEICEHAIPQRASGVRATRSDKNKARGATYKRVPEKKKSLGGLRNVVIQLPRTAIGGGR
eukprot:521896-Prorocentrum_minimum.AAC.3